MIFVKRDLYASFRRQTRANQELAIAELRNSSAVRQQSDRGAAITLRIVPAKAGTHNHRRLLPQKVSDTNVSSISRGRWVSAFACFRRDDASGFRTANMASRSRGWKRPRFALNFLTLSFRGRRESRVPIAPVGPVQKKHGGRTTGSTGYIRLSLHDGVTVSFELSPVTGLSCHRHP